MRGWPASGGVTTYATLVDAEAATGDDNDIVYVVALESFYRYESAGAAYVDNNTSILSTGDGGNTRWLAVGGRYHYLEVISTGGPTTASTGLGKGALASLTTGQLNVGIGYNALGAATDEDACIAIGPGALDALTGAGYDGFIAIGRDALGACTGTALWDGSIAIGDYALSAVTTGYSNIGIGRNVGWSITTGSGNVIIGDATLTGAASTGVANNVVIGFSSTTHANYTGSGNVIIGSTTMANAAAACSNNVVVGYNSATNVTTATYSVIIGQGAGIGIQTGHYNTVVGAAGGRGATASTRNCAFGYETFGASGANTAGNDNIAFGYQSMRNCGAIDSSIAIGSGTLYGTSGDRHVVVGHEAGNDVTTGTDLCLFGFNAGTLITESIGCVAIGNYALDALTGVAANTSYHVAVGYDALGACTTPGANAPSTAVGPGALKAVTTGSGHTALGYNAGAAVTTNSGGIYLGYDAGSADTAANKLHIGNNSTKSLIEGLMTSGSERAEVHGELRDDVTANDYNCHIVYGEAATAPVANNWLTVCSLTPDTVAGIFTRGVIKVRYGGAHNVSNSTGWSDAYYYFNIANAAPTAATVVATTTSGTNPPSIQLNISGNTIEVQVQAADGANTFVGYCHVEIWVPKGVGTAVYTFAH